MGDGPSFNPFANRTVMRFLNRKAEAARESLTRSGERARLDEEELHALERKLHYGGSLEGRPERPPLVEHVGILPAGMDRSSVALRA